eukprot:4986939-Pyramimonas_sp.AAC.2
MVGPWNRKRGRFVYQLFLGKVACCRFIEALGRCACSDLPFSPSSNSPPNPPPFDSANRDRRPERDAGSSRRITLLARAALASRAPLAPFDSRSSAG